MKKYRVRIDLDLEVPEDWKVVTADGFQAFQLPDGSFVDYTFAPMVADSLAGPWTDNIDDDLGNELLEKVTSASAEYSEIG